MCDPSSTLRRYSAVTYCAWQKFQNYHACFLKFFFTNHEILSLMLFDNQFPHYNIIRIKNWFILFSGSCPRRNSLNFSRNLITKASGRKNSFHCGLPSVQISKTYGRKNRKLGWQNKKGKYLYFSHTTIFGGFTTIFGLLKSISSKKKLWQFIL